MIIDIHNRVVFTEPQLFRRLYIDVRIFPTMWAPDLEFASQTALLSCAQAHKRTSSDVLFQDRISFDFGWAFRRN